MITILYSCALCGIVDREVIIPARESGDDVVVWMKETVTALLGEDHGRVSPQCHPKSLANIKIPMPPGTQFIGQQVK